MRDLIFWPWCCWRFQAAGCDAVWLGHYFPIFRRNLMSSEWRGPRTVAMREHRACSPIQGYNVTSQNAWINKYFY